MYPLNDLDQGEAETIILAHEINADIIIYDRSNNRDDDDNEQLQGYR